MGYGLFDGFNKYKKVSLKFLWTKNTVCDDVTNFSEDTYLERWIEVSRFSLNQ